MLSLYEYIQVRNDFANMIVLTKKKNMIQLLVQKN